MAVVKGGFQRLFQTILYALLFLCSAIILGIYSYFLSVLADRNLLISDWKKAVEGISGAACVYLIFAVILTCCLGGIAFLAFLAIVLDVLFAAGMIAIAVMTRDGASSCKGTVTTPIGTGPAKSDNQFGGKGFGEGSQSNVTYKVKLGLACRLNTAAFAVSIIAALLFLCTAAMQVALVRHHKKEKRYGPSPSNNYTSGYGKFGFGRKKRGGMKDAEAGTGVAATNNRYSNGTGYTGTTVGGASPYENKYEGHHGTAGYHTAPTGTAVNPYGYNNTATNY